MQAYPLIDGFLAEIDPLANLVIGDLLEVHPASDGVEFGVSGQIVAEFEDVHQIVEDIAVRLFVFIQIYAEVMIDALQQCGHLLVNLALLEEQPLALLVARNLVLAYPAVNCRRSWMHRHICRQVLDAQPFRERISLLRCRRQSVQLLVNAAQQLGDLANEARHHLECVIVHSDAFLREDTAILLIDKAVKLSTLRCAP